MPFFYLSALSVDFSFDRTRFLLFPSLSVCHAGENVDLLCGSHGRAA